jgi:hypothetical protein
MELACSNFINVKFIFHFHFCNVSPGFTLGVDHFGFLRLLFGGLARLFSVCGLVGHLLRNELSLYVGSRFFHGLDLFEGFFFLLFLIFFLLAVISTANPVCKTLEQGFGRLLKLLVVHA